MQFKFLCALRGICYAKWRRIKQMANHYLRIDGRRNWALVVKFPINTNNGKPNATGAHYFGLGPVVPVREYLYIQPGVPCVSNTSSFYRIYPRNRMKKAVTFNFGTSHPNCNVVIEDPAFPTVVFSCTKTGNELHYTCALRQPLPKPHKEYEIPGVGKLMHQLFVAQTKRGLYEWMIVAQ